MEPLHDYNQKTYENICRMYQEGIQRVAVVQPTGSGKSLLMAKLIEDNNIIHLYNVYPEKLLKYFPNIGQNVIVFNTIKTDTQARLSGHDVDSDFVYVTDQSDLADLARKAYVEYPTIVNDVKELSESAYHFTLEDYAKMDNEIADAQESIGTSTDIAQLALSYYYDGNMESKELENCFIILSVIGQISIDLAKKNFDIEVVNEINRIRNLPCMKSNKIPKFFADNKKSRNNKDFQGKRIVSMKCPMSDLTKEQASLQKILASYENDLSEESKQKIQQIKVRLEENAQEIEQNEYEKFINDSKKLLNDLYLEYETALNQRLDNIDALIADMIASSNANAGMISDTLSSKADSVGYYLSESMEDIWNTNTGSMLDALAMYDSNIMGGFAEVNTSVGEVIRGVTETVSGIGNVNTTITNAINSVTGNMQAILDKLSAISTMQSASAASSYYGGSGGTGTSSSGSSGTGSSGSGSSGSGGSGGSGFFIYSKDSYPNQYIKTIWI